MHKDRISADMFPEHYPTGALVGCVNVVDVLTVRLTSFSRGQMTTSLCADKTPASLHGKHQCCISETALIEEGNHFRLARSLACLVPDF